MKLPTLEELKAAIQGVDLSNLRTLVDAAECEEDLYTYYKRSWAAYEPAAFQGGWHLEAIADHLMAVSDGSIRRLAISVPPRHSKTAMTSIAWPTWTWAQKKNSAFPLYGPGVQFLCVSYGTDKATEDAVTARRLIGSEWFQERWGEKSESKRVLIAKDRDNQGRYDTTKGGSRISVGIEASVLGRGGNIKILDDVHKPDEVESNDVRDKVLRAYDETLSSRENDPNIAAEVLIMQRLHSQDIIGHVLDKFAGDKNGFVYLSLPMEFDPERKCYTVLGINEDGEELIWEDPREEKGEILWAERYKESDVEFRKKQEGPWSWSAKYQQMPVPRGGGIIQSDWWRRWEKEEFPACSTVLVSLDTASTEKEENDESAITVWGAWMGASGNPQIILMDAWEGFMEFSRLLKQTSDMARKHKADILLVEAKNVGQAISQEVRRMFGRHELSVVEFNPKGDKVARLLSVQHLFSGDYVKDPKLGEYWTGGMIWCPYKDWADLVMDRCERFPKDRRKGLVDTTSQAIEYLRKNGIILRKDEYDEEREEEMRYQKPRGVRYDV